MKKSALFILFALISVAGFSQITGVSGFSWLVSFLLSV